jgi:hypothetical protein
MDAAQFYKSFEEGFASSILPIGCKRLAGTQCKWKLAIPDGALYFSIATNPKSAGLLDLKLWPGEFRPVFDWQNGKGKWKVVTPLSIFEYADSSEKQHHSALRRQALGKYLQSGGTDQYGTLSQELAALGDQKQRIAGAWCYFVDTLDASEWGAWHGKMFTNYVRNFIGHAQQV